MRAAVPHRDATLISALAYAGLRPQETRALRWAHVGERTLLVTAPKTRTRRNVRLLTSLAADLRE
jgi:integrase